MSLLLSRLSKLPSRKATALRHVITTRFFSTSLSQTLPCSIAGAQHCGSTLRDGDIGNLKIYNNPSDGFIVTDKKVPMKLVEEMGTIGSSNGWVATLKEGVVCLQDDLNPNASDTDPKRISLPPLVNLPHCQTQIVTNVAMSASSPEDDDCVVAVKFLGPQLSFCRPARGNSEWTNVRIIDTSFFNSRVMYSKRDEMFSMPASRGTYIGSWDLGEHRDNPKIQKLRFQDFPELVQSEWELLDLCYRSEQLVESRNTGEMFLVKWYTKRDIRKKGKRETHRFMVFKIDEDGSAVYTRDIGDLCIFLSKAEPFCVRASLCHKSPNCVYFLGPDLCGVVNLHDYNQSIKFGTYPVPYYIPPKSSPKLEW